MDRAKLWRTTAKIAWRDLRNSGTRPLFIIAVLAASIASVSGVHSAAQGARQALETDSRAWLAGDLCIDTRDPIDREQVRQLDQLEAGGVHWTLMTTLLTTASSSESADAGLIQIKAIDPAVYPFYGAITLDPPQPLARALTGNSMAASDEVLERFSVRIGDTIALAGHPFRISAVIKSEPDRFANEVGLGLRCILSRAAFEQSGFEAPPHPVKHRVLLKLSAASNLRGARRFLQQLFPEGNLRDVQTAHHNEAQIFETVISFLSVTAFLALTLGAIAAAIAFREHAEQSLSTLAILRTLGAQTRQLGSVFFLQAAAMIVIAIVLGIGLGSLLSISILSLASRYLILPVTAGWDGSGILQSALVAILIVAPVLIQPSLWIRRIRPAVVLRRAMWTGASAERSESIPPVLQSISGWIAMLASCTAFVAIGKWILESWRSTLLLGSAIIAVSVVTLSLATGAVHLLRWIVEHIPLKWRARVPRIRFGLASIYGPGRRSAMLIAALAISAMVTIAMFESRAAVVRTLIDIIPSDRMNLYVAGFRGSAYTGLVALMERMAGAENVEVTTQVRLQLTAVDLPPGEASAMHRQMKAVDLSQAKGGQSAPMKTNGTCEAGFTLHSWDGVNEGCIDASLTHQLSDRERSFDDIRGRLLQASDGANALRADEWNYYYARLNSATKVVDVFPTENRYQTMTVDYYLERRENVEFKTGASYLAQCGASPANDGALPALTLRPELSALWNAHIGSRVRLETRSSSFESIVTAIHDLPESERIWASMELDCSRLDPAILIHEVGVRLPDDRIHEVEQTIRASYPTAAVVTKQDVEQTVTGLTSDAIGLTRLVGWYAIVCGFGVLLALMAATRAGRRTEAAIFSAVGASPGTMLRIYSVEFAATGFISAAIAGLLAWSISGAALRVILHQPGTIIGWRGIATAWLFASAAALLGGWLPILPVLSRKPMETLRGE